MAADQEEQRLIDICNDIADALRQLRRGDPDHFGLTAALVQANRDLNRYRKTKAKKK